MFKEWDFFFICCQTENRLSDPALGDVLMLSDGIRGVDNVYSLKDGIYTPSCHDLH
jgi:hypothetical protein